MSEKHACSSSAVHSPEKHVCAGYEAGRIRCSVLLNVGKRSWVGSVLVAASWLGDRGGEVIGVSAGRSRLIWIRRFANKKIKRFGKPGRARSSPRAIRTRVCALGAGATVGV